MMISAFLCFNTHPMWDGATPWTFYLNLPKQFQYTPRVGRGDMLEMWMKHRAKFQYTPRVGRGDLLLLVHSIKQFLFQYTPRAGRGDKYCPFATK
ncbi:MAG: hypothetical protein IKB25_08310 [Lentisphaeria bacterium]|nr:hypothetical protein [Lentisphaeria bacterium]